MTAKNNHSEVAQRLPHYGLRKLSIGVASVLLSTTFYLGVSQATGLADSNVADGQQAVASQSGQLSAKLDKQTVTLNKNEIQNTTAAINQQLSQEGNLPASSDTNSSESLQATGKELSGTDVTISNIQASSQTGATDTDAGTTNLNVSIKISSEQAKTIHSGDYIDIRMGIPYTVTANGQKQFLSYGVAQEIDRPCPSQGLNVNIGRFMSVDASQSYVGTAADDPTSTNPNWLTVDKRRDAQGSLGASNGYYRLIFNDEVARLGNAGQAINLNMKMVWYNPNGQAAPLDSKQFVLHTTSNDKFYQPQDDILIGKDIKETSGLKIKLTKQATEQNNDELTPNTSTPIAAHWWKRRENGTYVLGLNPLTDSSQDEGVSLTKDVGNDFYMTVTVPSTDSSSPVKDFSFADDARVKHDIERTIVAHARTVAVDHIDGRTDINLGDQTLADKPTVTVTHSLSPDGKTMTYHVKIDGEYDGFKKDFNGSTTYESTVTLWSWRPKKATDLLPPYQVDGHPTNIDSFDHDSTSENDPNSVLSQYLAQHYSNEHAHVGGVMVAPELVDYLQKNPWSVKVTKAGSNQNLLPADKLDGPNHDQAGYLFQKYGDFGVKIPNDQGWIVAKTYPDYEIHPTYQIIRYWYDQIGNPSNATDTLGNQIGTTAHDSVKRQSTFIKENGESQWKNADPAAGHPNESAFYPEPDMGLVPDIPGYKPFVKISNGSLSDKFADLKNVGYQGYYTYTDSSNTPTTDYTRQWNYDKQQDALIVDVVYKPDDSQKATIKYQVNLEKQDGTFVKTIQGPTVLGQGRPGAAVDENVTNTWKKLISDTYQTQTYNDLTYKVVKHDVTVANGVHRTDSDPVKYSSDMSIEPVYTIWLMASPKPEPAKDKGQINIVYVDVDGSHKTSDFRPEDGKPLTKHDENKVVSGNANDQYSSYNLKWNYWKDNYQYVGSDSVIQKESQNSNLLTLSAGNLPKGVTTYYVYLKHAHRQDTQHAQVVETIHYIYGNGSKKGQTAASDYTDSRKFSRTNIVDAKTGEVIREGKWNIVDPFNQVDSPAITGYKPDQAYIRSYSVKHDSLDIVKTVKYYMNQKAVPETKTVHETIHYIYGNGPKAGQTAASDYTDSREFSRTNIVDATTNEVVSYGEWNIVDPFDQVDSPAITGYKADQAYIQSYPVNVNSQDIVKTVKYYENEQPVVQKHNVFVHYIDVSGKQFDANHDFAPSDGSELQYETAYDQVAEGSNYGPYTPQWDYTADGWQKVYQDPQISTVDQMGKGDVDYYIYLKKEQPHTPSTPDTPKTPTNPGKPDTPSTPENPVTPSTPTPTQPGLPQQTTPTSNVQQAKLPQTGNQNRSEWLAAGLGLLGLSGLLGLAKKRRF